jgi:hypothetical protein
LHWHARYSRDCPEGSFPGAAYGEVKQDISMTIEKCNLDAKVQTTYDRLVRADGASIRAVFDDVFDDMKGSTRQDRMEFVQLLNQKLELSGNLPRVLEATAQYEFDQINDGHSRVKDKLIKEKAKEFHNEDRLLEEQLVGDLLQSEALMKKEKHEGKFLGMGNKDGFDLNRLQTNVVKSNDRLRAEDVLRQIGTDPAWQDITQGRGYLTKDYINHRLNQNLVTHDLSPEQETALTYLNDKNNFKHASREVPVCNSGCLENATYERRITQTSLENFVGKKFAGTGYEYADSDQQWGVRDRQGAGWRAIADYDRRDNEYARGQALRAEDETCQSPEVSSYIPPRQVERRPVYRRNPAQWWTCDCDNNSGWTENYP